MIVSSTKLPDTDKKQMLRAGMPGGLLLPFSYDIKKLLSVIEIENEGRTDFISVANQLATLAKLKASSFDKPFIFCINATGNYLLARQLGVIFFYQAMKLALSNPLDTLGEIPVWHYLTQGFTNPTLNDYFEGKLNIPMLLVLDNIDVSMSSNKIEKAKDLINLFCDRPRILLIAGNKANEFCRDVLHIKLSGIIKLEANKQVRI